MGRTVDELGDRQMMARAIALSKESGQAGEYPYGAVICRGATVIAESINRVKNESDVTRHAEVVAIAAAQELLHSTSLEDCTLFASAEPCALCSYAIRESRIGRVVYGLHSPHMGGMSKWNVLADEDISRVMPEVFAAPPVIVGGFMAQEAGAALAEWNELVWMVMKRRGIFALEPPEIARAGERRQQTIGAAQRLMAYVRRSLFDWFGRRL